MAADALLQPYRSPPPVARSIRFAPLPEPHRGPSQRPDVPGLPISDPPFSSLSDDASIASCSSTSSSPQKPATYPIEPCSTSLTSGAPVSQVSPPSSDPEHAPTDHPPAPKSRRSFFRPFFRKSGGSTSVSPSSSIDLAPTSSIDSHHPKQTARRFNFTAEEILTLGTINLFRSASRTSRYSADHDLSTGEWDLSRWSSVNSAQSAPATKSTPIIGSPLTRSQSTRTFLSSSGNNNSTRPAVAPNIKPGRSRPFKGMRMLNGRVYGAPKRHGNPFANARDEADPEFVEWGYGGMGSVSGRHAAGMGGTRWERLQSEQSLDDPSLDDGSGMGWVKKRREEKKGRQKAKEQGDGKTQELSGSTGDPASAPNTKSESNSIAAAANAEAGTSTPASHPPLTPNLTRPSSASSSTPRKSPEREHILHAVTIPANYQRHHHHRSASKSSAIASDGIDESKVNPLGIRQVSKTQSESSDESDSESEEQRENDGDDEESDVDEFGQSKRKTALGAGVEKYARHNDLMAIPEGDEKISSRSSG